MKARVVIGTPAAQARVMQIVANATYDREWTASEVEEIRRMRYKMEDGAGASNLKRGPGGVVDIEFVVQMLQLVHGGKEPQLRTPETLQGLIALHAAGRLLDEPFAFFSRAYHMLRSIEGRLRLLDAAARHDFPATEPEQLALAHLLGYEQADALVKDVQSLTTQTRREFVAVFDREVAALC